MNTLFCPWESAQYLFYSSNVPSLLYYSHISAISIALLLGFFVLIKGERSPLRMTLFYITILFVVWCVFDLILWATNDPKIVMFFWSLQVLIEPLIYAFSIYMAYVFMKAKDMSFNWKLILLILLAPIIFLLNTDFVLRGVELVDCTGLEGFVATYYTYIFEGLSILAILGIVVSVYRKTTDKMRRKEITFFSLGIMLFLIAFSWGNITGSFTDNWTLAQAGLIGMPIFFGFLAYITVKFKTFNLRLMSAQILIFVLGFLVLSMYLVRKIENIKIIILFTLGFVVVLGYQLIKSVKKEVAQRERLEALSEELSVANDKLQELDKLKTEFISLATHQIRSPLTAIKGYASMVLEGSYGAIEPKVKEVQERIVESSTNLAMMIEDFLNVSKIESGGMKYEKTNFDLGEMASSMTKGLLVNAEKRGLKIDYSNDGTGPYMVNADESKLRQVILNFIDNAIKYTKEGAVHVRTIHKNSKVRFEVQDTGMGIDPLVKNRLFHKFSRGDGNRMNTTGSGLGLYLAKEIMKAHGGVVGADSEGAGKGSTFYIELESIK